MYSDLTKMIQMEADALFTGFAHKLPDGAAYWHAEVGISDSGTSLKVFFRVEGSSLWGVLESNKSGEITLSTWSGRDGERPDYTVIGARS